MRSTSPLRRARLERGYTTRQVAAMIGATHVTVSRYETGRRACPDDIKVELARIYNNSIEALFFEHSGTKLVPLTEVPA